MVEVVQGVGIQCPEHWSWCPNNDTWDTQGHRNKYHKEKEKNNMVEIAKTQMKKSYKSTLWSIFVFLIAIVCFLLFVFVSWPWLKFFLLY